MVLAVRVEGSALDISALIVLGKSRHIVHRAVCAQSSHEHQRVTNTFSGSGGIDKKKIMATAEQMQEALQQLQVQGARIAALEALLQIKSTRAQTAEQERSALIQTLVIRLWRVDTQSAYVHACKVWDQILVALTWASRSRKIVVKGCERSQRDRLTPWIDVFGEGADEEDEIDDFVGKLCTYLCVLHNRRSQQDRPKRRRRKWLGSLETIAQRVRPDVVHETCGDPSAGSEPTALSAS